MAIYVKVNDNETLYPAVITGRMNDENWDNRETKTIKLEMTYEQVKELFVDDVAWSIVQENIVQYNEVDENGEVQFVEKTEMESYDNSEYCIAGYITDYRDGTVDVKMGKFTNEELLLMEVLA